MPFREQLTILPSCLDGHHTQICKQLLKARAADGELLKHPEDVYNEIKKKLMELLYIPKHGRSGEERMYGRQTHCRVGSGQQRWAAIDHGPTRGRSVHRNERLTTTSSLSARHKC